MTRCFHHYARHTDGDGRIWYTCTVKGCNHTVDWTAAREEYERLPYDPSAGMIDTPHGPGRWVGYDAARQVVIVEMGWELLVEYQAGQCFLPASGGRLAS